MVDYRDPEFSAELEGWAGRVLRLRSEMQAAVPADLAWGPYDLLGVCHNRQRIEKLGIERSFALEAVDELFRSFTVEVGSGWVDAIGMSDEKRTGWWWERIPAHGPLRDELVERGFRFG